MLVKPDDLATVLAAMKGMDVPAIADSQTAALSDNANANIAQGGYAEDLVAADLDRRSQNAQYYDGADGADGGSGMTKAAPRTPGRSPDGSLGR